MFAQNCTPCRGGRDRERERERESEREIKKNLFKRISAVWQRCQAQSKRQRNGGRRRTSATATVGFGKAGPARFSFPLAAVLSSSRAPVRHAENPSWTFSFLFRPPSRPIDPAPPPPRRLLPASFVRVVGVFFLRSAVAALAALNNHLAWPSFVCYRLSRRVVSDSPSGLRVEPRRAGAASERRRAPPPTPRPKRSLTFGTRVAPVPVCCLVVLRVSGTIRFGVDHFLQLCRARAGAASAPLTGSRLALPPVPDLFLELDPGSGRRSLFGPGRACCGGCLCLECPALLSAALSTGVSPTPCNETGLPGLD